MVRARNKAKRLSSVNHTTIKQFNSILWLVKYSDSVRALSFVTIIAQISPQIFNSDFIFLFIIAYLISWLHKVL